MTALILLVQVVLPLALIVWFALAPASNAAGFILQAVGIGALLFALARVAQWAVPVWWLPWVYGGLWLLVVLAFLIGKGFDGLPLLPAGLWAWSALAFSFVLLGVGGWYGAWALAGKRLPSVQVIDIANPFGPGKYLVGHGGSNTLVNGHMGTLDTGIERFRPWRWQSYAVDFFGLGTWGLRARGWRPSDPADYAIFGAELLAPCEGLVIAAEGDMPDFEVPDMDPVNRLGNHVILRCGEVEIVLAHMRGGSVVVVPGEQVAVGDRLGEVGNSGASTEPHLHIHAQRPAPDGEPSISGEPLAIRIDGRFLVRGDRLSGRLLPH